MLPKEVNERVGALWNNGLGLERYIMVSYISLGEEGSVIFSPYIANSSAFPCLGRSPICSAYPLSS